MNKITVNSRIRFGKPCVRGTRIAVADILNLISAGYTIDEIPVQYPGITRKDITAALAFAGKLANEPSLVFTKNAAA